MQLGGISVTLRVQLGGTSVTLSVQLGGLSVTLSVALGLMLGLALQFALGVTLGPRWGGSSSASSRGADGGLRQCSWCHLELDLSMTGDKEAVLGVASACEHQWISK